MLHLVMPQVCLGLGLSSLALHCCPEPQQCYGGTSYAARAGRPRETGAAEFQGRIQGVVLLLGDACFPRTLCSSHPRVAECSHTLRPKQRSGRLPCPYPQHRLIPTAALHPRSPDLSQRAPLYLCHFLYRNQDLGLGGEGSREKSRTGSQEI